MIGPMEEISLWYIDEFRHDEKSVIHFFYYKFEIRFCWHCFFRCTTARSSFEKSTVIISELNGE